MSNRRSLLSDSAAMNGSNYFLCATGIANIFANGNSQEKDQGYD